MAGLLNPADVERSLRWTVASWFRLRGMVPDLGTVTYQDCAEIETRIGIEPGKISSCAGYLRTRSGVTEAALVRPDIGQLRLEHVRELVQRACHGRVNGQEWIALASAAVDGHREVLDRTDELTGMLLAQMLRACHLFYRQSALAANLWAGIPQAQSTMLEQIQRVVADPQAPRRRQPLMVLENIPTPEAVDFAIEMVRRAPDHTRTEQALRVLTTLVERGAIGVAERSRVGLMVLAAWRSDPRRTRVVMADLIAAMPAGFRETLDRAVLEPPEALTRLAGIARVEERMAAHLATPDVGALRHLRAAIGDPSAERRHLASVVLAASAYFPVVAEVCMQVLEAEQEDNELRGRAAELLRYVCTDGQRLRIQSMLTDPDPVVATFTTHACGQLRPSMLLDQAIRAHITLSEDSANRARVGVLGMHGSSALPLLVDSSTTPEWMREMARWWIQAGPAIR